METGMDKNTLLLERCKLELDALAADGDSALTAAVAQTEKQVRSCTLEWKQAQKVVELTDNQQKTIEKARSIAEGRLAEAVAEEEDARVAAETVQRMIEDANAVRGVSNSETAKILQKASSLLNGTAIRATDFYREKKERREELDDAMRRLNASEKAILYTMAKAERNASEKILVKLIAERRNEVCTAEYEVLSLAERYKSLMNRKEKESLQFDSLKDELEAAGQIVNESVEAEKKRLEQANDEVSLCEYNTGREIDVIQQEIDEQQCRLKEAPLAVDDARTAYELCAAEGETAAEHVSAIENKSKSAIEQFNNDKNSELSALETEIAELRQIAADYATAYQEAVEYQRQTDEETSRLQQLADESVNAVRAATEEEQAARDAVATSNRLAENATKIRESINNESSDLLLHAQEVLIEAANSAKQLMQEKNVQRQRAEQENREISEHAAAAAQVAQEAALQTEMKQVDCQQAEAALQVAEERFNQRKIDLENESDMLISEAEKELNEARAIAEEKAQAVENAAKSLAGAEAELDEIEQTLQQLNEEKQRIIEIGESQLKNIRTVAERELKTLTDSRQSANAEVERLEQRVNSIYDIISSLNSEIDQTGNLIEEAEAKVNDIIAIGVLDIISAEEAVSGCRYKEDVARRAVEEVSMYLGNYDANRFSSLGEYDDIYEGTEEDDLSRQEKPVGILIPEPEMDEIIVDDENSFNVELPDEYDDTDELLMIDDSEVFADHMPSDKESVDNPAEDPAEAPVLPDNEQLSTEQAESELHSVSEEQLSSEEQLIPDEPVVELEPDERRSLEDLSPQITVNPVDEVFISEAESQPDNAAPQPQQKKDLLLDAEDDEEDLPGLIDFTGLTKEEIEYTQRLAVLSSEMVAKAVNNPTPRQEPSLPVGQGVAYTDWMDNLARSLSDEDEIVETTAKSDAAEKSTSAEYASEDSKNTEQIDNALDYNEDIPTIREATIVNDPQDDNPMNEDDMRMSMFNKIDESNEGSKENQPKKRKRRFPFFYRS